MTTDTKLRLRGMIWMFGGVLAFFNWLYTESAWRWLHLAVAIALMRAGWKIRKMLP